MISWRGDAHSPDRPGDLPLPPKRMPLRLGGNTRKRWRYVAAFCEEAMLCVGLAQIGPAAQGWWAVWDRHAGALRERTLFAAPRRHVSLAPGAVRVRDGDVEIDLVIDEGPGVESVCPHGSAWVWTRKQAGVAIRGSVRVAGSELAIDGLGVVDDTAGYHARYTAWRWSAGVGATDDGSVVGWNLVEGVNDPPVASERSLWVAGTAREVGPVIFADDLSSVRFAEGGELAFVSEAVRERHDDLLVMCSDYVQPFGHFSGILPGGARLAQGLGVMEHHTARW